MWVRVDSEGREAQALSKVPDSELEQWGERKANQVKGGEAMIEDKRIVGFEIRQPEDYSGYALYVAFLDPEYKILTLPLQKVSNISDLPHFVSAINKQMAELIIELEGG